MAEISVVIPVYNVEKYLKRCLDSVINQTFKDIEIICVNDGSSDGSPQILEEYAAKDKRIVVLSQQNSGASVARNNGVKNATGKYINFCDSDDYLHPQCLEIVHYFASTQNADLVCFDYKEDRKSQKSFEDINKDKIKYTVSEHPVFLGSNKEKFRIIYGPCTKLYKKSLIEDIYFMPNNLFEDFPHTFAALSKNPRTVVIKESLYYYDVHYGSQSHSKGAVKQINDYHKSVNYIYDVYKKRNLNKELEFLKINFIPNILKHQFNRCRRADKTVRPQMYEAFAYELQDLKEKNMLSWRGHKLSRYIRYLWLIKKLKNGNIKKGKSNDYRTGF